MGTPLISVILPTFNRAEFIAGALASFTTQTIPAAKFEVVVIVDGSTDATAEAVRPFEHRLNLKCLRTDHLGLAAAKNVGVGQSTAPILLFADDDDVADAHLLEEHLKSHAEHPEENVAVLGYTAWAPHVRPSPIMQCMPELRDSPFVYKDLHGGELLDYLYFWGGRSSCKRSLLERYGVFDPRFVWGEEDIELGLRLETLAGLRVLFNRNAVSYMARPLTFEGLCTRSVRQGHSMFQLSVLAHGQRAQRYLGTQLLDPLTWRPLQLELGVERWEQIEGVVDFEVSRVCKMESAMAEPLPRQKKDLFKSELKDAYWWTLCAFKLKGFAEEMTEHRSSQAESNGTPDPEKRNETESPETDDSVGLTALKRELSAEKALLDAQQAYSNRLENHLESLWNEVAWREEQIRQMKATRIWRLGELYWRVLGRVKQRLRPQRPVDNNK